MFGVDYRSGDSNLKKQIRLIWKVQSFIKVKFRWLLAVIGHCRSQIDYKIRKHPLALLVTSWANAYCTIDEPLWVDFVICVNLEKVYSDLGLCLIITMWNVLFVMTWLCVRMDARSIISVENNASSNKNHFWGRTCGTLTGALPI